MLACRMPQHSTAPRGVAQQHKAWRGVLRYDAATPHTIKAPPPPIPREECVLRLLVLQRELTGTAGEAPPSAQSRRFIIA